MNEPLLVSIVIDNYNYGRYLGDAIESVLRQSYSPVELIVVDDGSTDESAPLIASYGPRLKAILKENGGQASALNAGFSRARGEIVVFLDSDDLLHPTLIERVVFLMESDPEIVRVQYRLAEIDKNGSLIGETKPPRHRTIPAGNLRKPVLYYADDIPWLPTSGNAFTRGVLEKIFPIPEEPYRICADYYLSNLTPLYGDVAALDEVGGYYRVHGANNHQNARLDLLQLRQMVVRTWQTHHYIGEHAQRLGLMGRTDKVPGTAPNSTDEIAPYSVTSLANRMVTLRLSPSQYPLAGDSRMNLARKGVQAAWRHPDLTILLRAAYTLWFCLSSFVPRPVLIWMAEQLFYPESSRKWLSGLLSTLQRSRPVAN